MMTTAEKAAYIALMCATCIFGAWIWINDDFEASDHADGCTLLIEGVAP